MFCLGLLALMPALEAASRPTGGHELAPELGSMSPEILRAVEFLQMQARELDESHWDWLERSERQKASNGWLGYFL